MRVLIVEDEIYLADAVRAGLRREAIAADVVYDGMSALESLSVNDYDVAVLDRDLPGLHGDEICDWLTANRPDCRILMLTAARTLRDKVEGFQAGADDYLAKPSTSPNSSFACARSPAAAALLARPFSKVMGCCSTRSAMKSDAMAALCI